MPEPLTIPVSEFSGWLYKKGHGSVHIGNIKMEPWNRRFFILHIKLCRLRYYAREPLEGQKINCRGDLQITNFSEPATPIHRPPHEMGCNLGLIIVTTDPIKSSILLCADTPHEKALWIKYLQMSLNSTSSPPKPRSITTWKSISRLAHSGSDEDHTDDDGLTLDADKRSTSNHSNNNSPTNRLKSISSSHHSFDLKTFRSHHKSRSEHRRKLSLSHTHKTKNLYIVVIASFIFDIGTLGRMSTVCKSWNKSYSRKSKPKLWTWLVRHGAVANKDRWLFWCSCVGKIEIPTVDMYEKLVGTVSETVTADIKRDVDRSFGVNPNKRFVIRRSICREESDERHHTQECIRSFIQDAATSTESPDASLKSPSGCMSGGVSPELASAAICALNICESTSNSEEIEIENDHDIQFLSGGDGFPSCNMNGDDEDGTRTPPLKRHQSPRRPSITNSIADTLSSGGNHIPQWVTRRVNNLRKLSQDIAHSPSILALTSISPLRPTSRSVSSLRSHPSRDYSSDECDGEDAFTLGKVETPVKEKKMRSVMEDVQYAADIKEDDISRKKETLTRILKAFAAKFEEVGYCQGLDRIVLHAMRSARCAVSTSSLTSEERVRRDQTDSQREREVFAFICSIFEKLELSEMYSKNGVIGLRVRVAILQRLIERHCPELYEHISSAGLPIDAFGISWIQTLFLYIEAMPALTIDKIWDIFLNESKWNVIYSVAIAMLKMSEQDLLTKNIDEIIFYFDNFPDPDVLNHRILLRQALNLDISSEYLKQLEAEIREKLH